MRDDMEIQVIGDEIYCNGMLVAKIICSIPSLAGDFKDWVIEQSGNGEIQAYIEGLENERESLENEREDLQDNMDCLITELEEAVNDYDSSRDAEEKLKDCRNILLKYSR